MICQITPQLLSLRAACIQRHIANKNFKCMHKCIDACIKELDATPGINGYKFYKQQFVQARLFLCRGVMSMGIYLMTNVIAKVERGQNVYKSRLLSGETYDLETLGNLAILPKDMQRMISLML